MPDPTKNLARNLASVAEMIAAKEPQEPIDIQFAMEVTLHAFDQIKKLKPIIKCETCYFYENGICKKANTSPPENIIPVGCELWMDFTLDPWDLEMWEMPR